MGPAYGVRGQAEMARPGETDTLRRTDQDAHCSHTGLSA